MAEARLDPGTMQIVIDGDGPLILSSLVRQLRSIDKLMKAHGAEETQVMSLHYDHEPPKKKRNPGGTP